MRSSGGSTTSGCDDAGGSSWSPMEPVSLGGQGCRHPNTFGRPRKWLKQGGIDSPSYDEHKMCGTRLVSGGFWMGD